MLLQENKELKNKNEDLEFKILCLENMLKENHEIRMKVNLAKGELHECCMGSYLFGTQPPVPPLKSHSPTMLWFPQAQSKASRLVPKAKFVKFCTP